MFAQKWNSKHDIRQNSSIFQKARFLIRLKVTLFLLVNLKQELPVLKQQPISLSIVLAMNFLFMTHHSNFWYSCWQYNICREGKKWNGGKKTYTQEWIESKSEMEGKNGCESEQTRRKRDQKEGRRKRVKVGQRWRHLVRGEREREQNSTTTCMNYGRERERERERENTIQVLEHSRWKTSIRFPRKVYFSLLKPIGRTEWAVSETNRQTIMNRRS